jgi:hypothetical protein
MLKLLLKKLLRLLQKEFSRDANILELAVDANSRILIIHSKQLTNKNKLRIFSNTTEDFQIL